MDIYNKIDNAKSESEVKELLLTLKVKELKEVAAYYNVFVMKPNKKNYIERITSNTVGLRLRSIAINQVELK
ncbi:hypothetical protein J2S74_005392 [Evansella vedderi]|uniref:Ribosomal protein L23 n=1 Tax=Evansella vedderi TaxID=38282 RepID=A0ABU0A364_9BACI|nr:hypothetical protein [Evansella vedderi]MDQ0257929.1 hypothetical protein [Evansella vedderi]